MENLKRIRENAGLTQEDLARKAGLTLSGLRQVETGRREPRLATAQAIASALGVPIEQIWPYSAEHLTDAEQA